MATDTNIATMVSVDVDDETNSGNSTDTNNATMVSVDVDHINDAWMNPGNVEDEDEYEISKFLLEKFVCSQAVQEIVGDNKFLIPKIISFLRKHVYTWETLYLHYRRRYSTL